ncbi:MAG: hypothetical protein HY962_09180 [Ignavibacteriae bacterium]|nr:hypothetical protein [Ignavibacteriota bacterium]
MKSLFVAIFLLGLSGLTVHAQETFAHKDAGVEITIPAGWFYESGDEAFTIYTPGKELGISLSVMEAHQIDNAIAEVTADLQKEFTAVNLGEVTQAKSNGMDSWEVAGTATMRDGQPVIIYYCMVVTPTAKILEISAVGTSAEFEKYSDEIRQLDESLKPIK